MRVGREFQSRERGNFAALLLSLLDKSKGSVLCSPGICDLQSAKCWAAQGAGRWEGRQLPHCGSGPLRGAGGELASSLPAAKEKDCAIYIFLENPFRRG